MGIMDDISAGVSSAKASLQSAAGAVSKAASALNSVSSPSSLMAALRSANVPSSPGGASSMTKVSFGGTGNAGDWRVRLSLPPNFFEQSSVLKPLKDAGGLVFPYTPTITLQHTASYEDVAVTHQNYQFIAYQNSRADTITISGPFNVEDYVQAQYWISALHFLRSATKMYTGDTEFVGSPPPILYLNGYGDYVFKNVPVVVKSFTIDLPADVDYIATTMGTPEYNSPAAATGGNGGGKSDNGLGMAAGLLTAGAGLAGALGGAKLAQSLGKGAAAVGVAAGALGMVSSLAKSASVAGGAASAAAAAAGGGSFQSTTSATHVPTKSTISVTVQPIYSREAVRQFSLKTFVNGGYVNGTGGYI